MEIKRQIESRLVAWQKSFKRKPLVLRGVRQVGKTYLLRQFGKVYFSDVAYFNFEERPELKQFFRQTKDVNRILENLTLVYGKPIEPQNTLIIFDEIQECNEALNSLKYFNENAPEYAITCAGSLLGVALSKGESFPVGKVDFLEIQPLTFQEFLSADDPALFAYLESISQPEPLPDIFFNPLVDKLKKYFICGGMPEAAVTMLEDRDIEKTQQVLQNILNAYALDFSKYAETRDVPRINHIFSSIPSQLAKENKKFLYQAAQPGARARDYENALLWLADAGLIHRIFRINKPGLPLSAYDDLSAFKLYLSDVALLRRLSGLHPSAISEGNRLFIEFKGALTENYILQHLLTQFESIPRYWTSGAQAEVDFIIQAGNEVLPAEVKSDENVRSRSLTLYQQHFSPPLRIRYSLRNLKLDDGLLNIPLFMAGYTEKLIRGSC